jgi:flagellar biosynthesis protein FlhB
MASSGNQAGEPTEEPTAKRLEETRRRGEVAYSRDLVSAAAMTAAIGALVMQGPALAARLVSYLRGAFAGAVSGRAPSAALLSGLDAMAGALAAPLGAALLVALVAGFLQTRGLLALEAARPDLGRLSPAAGLRRLFGGQAAIDLGKGMLKVLLVGALAWITLRPLLAGLMGLTGASPARILTAIGVVAERLALRVALVALALGFFDYLLARRRHLRRLRMTRDEIKRETKESEGDPTHRAERQRLHRELAEQRMVAEVRKADFVVVNPDHIAVALRYDREGEGAPVVVARGERLLAERIKATAREAGVPIFRDVTLARSLRDLAEGQEIPVALYEAVAEILRVVYGTAPTAPAPASPGTGTAAPPAGAGWKRA